ncbi:glycosyltransferase [uncultured Amnibacterium sp.]|uniref:glycosyltransferase n=1 Tax=uncultured Amnibacterium sp. TaxID=1631851 RepID=UPI0035CC1DB5
MTDVLLITSRRLDADDHGAGVRTARIAAVLADRYRVTVVEPAGDGDVPADGVITFPPRPLDLRLAASLASTEGASVWKAIEPVLPRLEATRAPVVFWADAILASAGLGRVLPVAVHVVEFANIESRRYLAMTLDGSVKRRAFAVLEAAKAVRWQRSVAARSDAVVALALGDARALRTSHPKLLVRNGIQAPARAPEPSAGATVLAVGSWWYGPNRHGMRRFLERDWPRVRAELPEARLRIVGAGGDDLTTAPPAGVEVAGFVDDLEAEYAAAAVVLAPARSGGGSQLKLVGALSHGRIVVGPAFLARERTPDLPDGAFRTGDDMAGAIVGLLRSPAERHAVEQRIRDYCLTSTWGHAARPLIRFVDRALQRSAAAEAAR